MTDLATSSKKGEAKGSGLCAPMKIKSAPQQRAYSTMLICGSPSVTSQPASIPRDLSCSAADLTRTEGLILSVSALTNDKGLDSATLSTRTSVSFGQGRAATSSTSSSDEA